MGLLWCSVWVGGLWDGVRAERVFREEEEHREIEGQAKLKAKGRKVRGTRTEKYLLASFAGESQVHARYKYFAGKAEAEGYRQIAAVFAATAEQELEHAERFFSFLEGGACEITSSYPAGIMGSTLDNLKAAAENENEEHTKLYPEAEKVAREEGFEEIAQLFHHVARAEAAHEKRYRALWKRVKEGTVFTRSEPIDWQCLNCGYVHHGKSAPEVCPACEHLQEWYEPMRDDY